MRGAARVGSGAIVAACVALAAGCGPAADHFQLQLSLTQGDEYRCPAPSCANITLSCDAVVSIRVVDAGDPSTVYVSKCLSLPVTTATNLCAIGQLDLGTAVSVPNKMVRVQVLVWPKVALAPDFACPTDVQFDAQGMPQEVAPSPAIGGQAYFLPGSADAVDVTLGCVDAGALNDATCRNPDTVDIAGTVDDFDTGVFVPPAVADTVTVSVGEPVPRTNPDTGAIEWQLGPTDVTPLARVMSSGPVPAWHGTVATPFHRAACLQVLEDGTQETPAITCHAATSSDLELQLRGFRLKKATLAQATSVLRLPGVPDGGIVVGIVVDHNGSPVAGASVLASKGNVQFLSADGTALDPGAVTTASGMFVSRDAPFDATWTVNDSHGLPPTEPVIGGLVVGKATVMFIQLKQPTSNP